MPRKKSSSAVHKRKVKKRKQQQKQLNRFLSIGIGVLVIAALVYFAWPQPEVKPLTIERLETYPSLGPEDSPVTIIEYGDFGCTTCRIWHQAGIRKKIIEDFGDQIKFVWVDYPIITAQSPKAAEAGQCAFDQGKFWEYHDYIFEQGSSLSVADLNNYAEKVGLDSRQFKRCLESEQNMAKVEHDLTQGYKLGIFGAPAFIVNDKKLAGPPMYETLKSIIDDILIVQ